MNLANKHRPRRLSEVVGQETEVQVLRTILEKHWRPNCLMITGPFGTGKTTLSRLTARALLCDNPQGVEPCGTCEACRAIDEDNHPNYTELDAASQGLISDVRAMKDALAYRAGSDQTRIICYDESHMLSPQAQNALLQTLEEGIKGVLFVFATTEANKMLPTIRSRCVLLQMKLLKASQIAERVRAVARLEEIDIEERAASVIGTYARGHVRDAITLLEQLSNAAGGKVTEQLTRTYLRLDRNDDVYRLLTMTDKKEAVENLETLLCNYAPSELTELVGEILLNAYKLKIGIDNFTQVDRGWLQKVLAARGDQLLDQAEATLTMSTDHATVTYGTAAFANILFEERARARGPKNGLTNGPNPTQEATPAMPTRKPGK